MPRLLTGGLACYRIYATADGRYLTVAALEPRFFSRLCELARAAPSSTARQWDADQEPLAAELAEAFAGEAARRAGSSSSRARTWAWGRSRRWTKPPLSWGEARAPPAARTGRAGGHRTPGSDPRGRAGRRARCPPRGRPRRRPRGESPTIAASRRLDLERARATARKIVGCGFVRPKRARAERRVHVEPVVRRRTRPGRGRCSRRARASARGARSSSSTGSASS